MMETNSTDDEKSTAKSLLVKAEKRKSPPKEYIGERTKMGWASCLLPSPSQKPVSASVSPESLFPQLTFENYLRHILCHLMSSPFLF